MRSDFWRKFGSSLARKFLSAPVVVLTTGFVAVARLSAASLGGTSDPFVEGEALVKYRQPMSLTASRQAVAQHPAAVVEQFQVLSERLGGTYVRLRSSTLTTEALLAELRADPLVEAAEPNYLRRPCEMRPPNDFYFGQLWGLRNTGQTVNDTPGTARADIGFLTAWGMARPATNEVVVGVIDTGLDYTHPDLVGNLWTNPGEIPGNGIDDDGNGFVDDVHGYNFPDGNGNIQDSSMHGTHVAGIIGAAGANGMGVIGVDFRVHLMGLKVSNSGTNLWSSDIIEALQYAILMKGRGVNLVALNASYGGGDYSSTERDAYQAVANAGIIVCAAAGNDTNNNDAVTYYPASYRLANMIVVAASDANDALASFSNYGAGSVDLAAPGVNIFSTTPVSQPGEISHVQQGATVYMSLGMEYGGTTPLSGISGPVYHCGLGYAEDFPAAVSGNIALIQRGTLTFAVKVSNAMAAGARAAIIYNNATGIFSGTLQTAGTWIPVVSNSQANGLALLGTLPAQATLVNATDTNLVYQFSDGTSMAAPYVAGAVAFAAMNFPNESVAQRIQRILLNTTPAAAFQGKTTTGGRLNLARVVDTDGNGLPDWWEQSYFGHLTGTSPLADADHDGQSNLAEWLAGTNPTNSASCLSLTPVRVEGPNKYALRWPSTPGLFYRLLGSTNLEAGFTQVILTNIPATPPLNTLSAPALPSASPEFYRLQLEP
jgi:subtilisin family serine protease